jgi:hypothetical protein
LQRTATSPKNEVDPATIQMGESVRVVVQRVEDVILHPLDEDLNPTPQPVKRACEVTAVAGAGDSAVTPPGCAPSPPPFGPGGGGGEAGP